MVHPASGAKQLESNVLVHQIESSLYDRQGRALTNFDRTLPAPQSELAQQLIKDPYNLLLRLHRTCWNETWNGV